MKVDEAMEVCSTYTFHLLVLFVECYSFIIINRRKEETETTRKTMMLLLIIEKRMESKKTLVPAKRNGEKK